jgi:hypothetical protein
MGTMLLPLLGTLAAQGGFTPEAFVQANLGLTRSHRNLVDSVFLSVQDRAMAGIPYPLCAIPENTCHTLLQVGGPLPFMPDSRPLHPRLH